MTPPPHRKAGVSFLIAGCLAVALVVLAAANYIRNQDGLSIVDADIPALSYALVFVLVTLDAVVPVFPGETTLNVASTAAAQGLLELAPIIVMGALGAIVGDSALYWIARMFSRRVEPTLERARSNEKAAQALEILDSSTGLLIVGGRYVMGMRFVVNAMMGISRVPYLRFLGWSVLAGALWSTFTCVLAYQVAARFSELPLASVVISGLVTTVVVAMVFVVVRKRRTARRDPTPSQAAN